MRRCYIAQYPLAEDKKDLREEILIEDTSYSEKIDREWDRLVELREPNFRTDPMLQCWYSDETQVTCMAQTNQPFLLE